MWQATQRVCIFTFNPKLSVTFPLPWLDLDLSQLHFVIDGEGAAGKGEKRPKITARSRLAPLELFSPACSLLLAGIFGEEGRSGQEAAELALDQMAGTHQLLPEALGNRAWHAHCKSSKLLRLVT